ncbi:MAG: AI-2E family transporter [Nitrospirota bacterium]
MKTNRFYIYSLVLLSLLLGYLVFQIMSPFLRAIAWAVVLSILFYPLFAYLGGRLRWRSVAAVVTLAIILVVIVGPVSYLAVLLVGEIQHVAAYIENGELTTIEEVLDQPRVRWFLENMEPIFGAEETDYGKILVEGVNSLGRNFLEKMTTGAKNVFAALVDFVFMSLTIFFLFRDGPRFLERFRDYMPFSEEQKDRLEMQTKDMVVSTIYGGVVVALVQGAMGGLAFFFVGIPAPVIWGTAIAIMSFIPMLGTFSVWFPAVIYLFLQGMYPQGLILFFIGTFGISMVDNILKPVIIGERTKMPTLIIFFSVLGGIKLFGLIGLILGPLVVALFISVLEIFRNIEGGENV